MIKIEAEETLDAYFAKPKGKPKGAVIVIHEVWGLVDHIKSIADRFAEEGYIALAPDLLFELDFSAVDVAVLQKQLFDPKTRNEVQPILRGLMTPIQEPDFGEKTVKRTKACFDYLYNLNDSAHKVSIIGYCFGGTYAYSLAVNEPRLKIAFPFYGHIDEPVEQLKKIKCPVRAFYGQRDERLIEGLDSLKEKMHEAGVDYQAKVYEGAGHAFFNDSNPFAFNKEAAEDAWAIVLKDLEF
jgi:carboxymethylenebutenolidase